MIITKSKCYLTIYHPNNDDNDNDSGNNSTDKIIKIENNDMKKI